MKKGFTLIEVLVVAVIVAILAAVAIPAYNGYILSSKQKVAVNTAATVAQSLATYYSDHQGVAPGTIAGWATGGAGAVLSIGPNDLKLPADFTCAATDAVVTVTHKDGTASGSVTWVVR